MEYVAIITDSIYDTTKFCPWRRFFIDVRIYSEGRLIGNVSIVFRMANSRMAKYYHEVVDKYIDSNYGYSEEEIIDKCLNAIAKYTENC